MGYSVSNLAKNGPLLTERPKAYCSPLHFDIIFHLEFKNCFLFFIKMINFIFEVLIRMFFLLQNQKILGFEFFKFFSYNWK